MGSLTVCDRHTGELRTALGGHDLLKHVGGEKFDPLAGAMLGAARAALFYGGPSVMEANADGTDKCPLCLADQNGGLAAAWTAELATEQLEKAREAGLAPKPFVPTADGGPVIDVTPEPPAPKAAVPVGALPIEDRIVARRSAQDVEELARQAGLLPPAAEK